MTFGNPTGGVKRRNVPNDGAGQRKAETLLTDANTSRLASLPSHRKWNAPAVLLCWWSNLCNCILGLIPDVLRCGQLASLSYQRVSQPFFRVANLKGYVNCLRQN